MAFIAMVFASIFVLLLMILVFLMLIFLVLATVFKVVGKKNGNRKFKTAGNVFLVLGIIFAAPLIALTAYSVYSSIYTEVTLPDGETKKVLSQHVSEMEACLDDPDESSVKALEELLDKDSNLVFYHDINHYSIIDNGIKMGNADIVRIALAHGAIFDDPERYDRMAYVSGSMDDFLEYDGCANRSITEDDVEILKLMFENNASTEAKTRKGWGYSNTFGKAVWAVLDYDESITDTELEFIQVVVDNGVASDAEFLFAEEVKAALADKYYRDIVRDGNYNQLMSIIGR